MTEPTTDREKRAARQVTRAAVVVLAALLGTFVWYLFADRYTPYTQQARIEGFVVGVAPKVSGVITKVWVVNDQQVQAGDRLFQIERAPYEIALARAKAQVAEARAQLEAARAAVAVARSRLASAEAGAEKAKQDAERQKRLRRRDSGTVSLRRVEIAQASLKEAVAKVRGAEADLRKAQEQQGSARQKLEAALAGVRQARLDLDNTLVRASGGGTVTDLQAHVGRYAGKGQAVLTLVATKELWIQARFTENNLGHLRAGTPVEFVLDALPGRVFEGVVATIGPGVSAWKRPAPGTLPTVTNSREWLRRAQRFPVVIRFSREQRGLQEEQLRVGGQAEVIAYTPESRLLKPLGRLFIRFMSWLSYLY